MKLIVVDDKEENLNAASKAANEEGHDVSVVDNFSDAETQIISGEFDGALLDIFMPVDEDIFASSIQLLRQTTDTKLDNTTIPLFSNEQLSPLMHGLPKEAPVGLLLGIIAESRQLAFHMASDFADHSDKGDVIVHWVNDHYETLERALVEGMFPGKQWVSFPRAIYILKKENDMPVPEFRYVAWQWALRFYEKDTKNKDDPLFWKQRYNLLALAAPRKPRGLAPVI